jgi:hypothetical protein
MTDQPPFDLKWLKAGFTRRPPSDFASVMNVARTLFERDGWQRTQLKTVEDMSHVKYASIRAMFASKRDLAIMVYREPLDKLITDARGTSRQEPSKELDNFQRALGQLFVKHPVVAGALRPTDHEVRDPEKDHPVLHELIRLLAVRVVAKSAEPSATDNARRYVLYLLDGHR